MASIEFIRPNVRREDCVNCDRTGYIGVRWLDGETGVSSVHVSPCFYCNREEVVQEESN